MARFRGEKAIPKAKAEAATEAMPHADQNSRTWDEANMFFAVPWSDSQAEGV
jgi:hypothetical protein